MYNPVVRNEFACHGDSGGGGGDSGGRAMMLILSRVVKVRREANRGEEWRCWSDPSFLQTLQRDRMVTGDIDGRVRQYLPLHHNILSSVHSLHHNPMLDTESKSSAPTRSLFRPTSEAWGRISLSFLRSWNLILFSSGSISRPERLAPGLIVQKTEWKMVLWILLGRIHQFKLLRPFIS